MTDWKEMTIYIIGALVIGIIFLAFFGSILYSGIHTREEVTARMEIMDGMNRCMYICTSIDYSTTNYAPCIEKCENNYEIANQGNYNG